MSVLLNDDLELRSGWRFVTFWIVYVFLFLSTSAVMSVLVSGPIDFGEISGLALSTMTFLPPAVLSFAFMLRFVDRRSPSAFGIGPPSHGFRLLGLGLATASGMVVVYSSLAGLLTGLDLRRGTMDTERVALTVVLLAIAAASEELVYRGYPLQVLAQAVGPVVAILVMSAAFGLGHHLNPNATWLGTLNTSLAGVLLSLAWLRTRSLWLPYGIHVGWNLATGVALGLPVSGVQLNSIWTASVPGSPWLTGGSFGPEGGILATVAIIAAAVFIVGVTGSMHSNHQEVL